VNTNNLWQGFYETKSKSRTSANKIVLGVVAFLVFIFVLVSCDVPGVETEQDIEYSIITVPSDRISTSYITIYRRGMFQRNQIIYSVSYQLYITLEASREQYDELRELRQYMGSGGFNVLPEYARRQRRYVMVELHYIPDAGRHPATTTVNIMENRGLLVGYTVLFEDNTVTVPGDAVELTQVPVRFRQIGVHPYTYHLTHGDDLNIEVSRSQYEELRELQGRGNVVLELHYRVQTGRLLEFTILDE